MKHKWHKEIKAWADGEEVEWKALITEYQWIEVGDGNPMWHRHDVEFRIKPQPKEPQYLYVYMNMQIDKHNYVFRTSKHAYGEYIGKIKLEVEDV